jgi:hypothetical protein
MATADTQRRATEAHPQTFDVTLRMAFEDTDLQPSTLEDLAVAVSEALDEHTGDEIVGVSVAGVFGPPALELGLDIMASSMSELQGVLSAVFAVIERECPLRFLAGDTHVERAEDDERELVSC